MKFRNHLPLVRDRQRLSRMSWITSAVSIVVSTHIRPYRFLRTSFETIPLTHTFDNVCTYHYHTCLLHFNKHHHGTDGQHPSRARIRCRRTQLHTEVSMVPASPLPDIHLLSLASGGGSPTPGSQFTEQDMGSKFTEPGIELLPKPVPGSAPEHSAIQQPQTFPVHSTPATSSINPPVTKLESQFQRQRQRQLQSQLQPQPELQLKRQLQRNFNANVNVNFNVNSNPKNNLNPNSNVNVNSNVNFDANSNARTPDFTLL